MHRSAVLYDLNACQHKLRTPWITRQFESNDPRNLLQADKHMDINDATWAIMREMSKLPYNVDDQQITRAKNQLKAQLLFQQDSPSGESHTHALSSSRPTSPVLPLYCWPIQSRQYNRECH